MAWATSGRRVAAGLLAFTLALGPLPAAARDNPVDTDERLRRKVHRYFEFWSQRDLDRDDKRALFRVLDDVRRGVGRDLDTYPGTKFLVIVTDAETFRDYSGQNEHVAGLFDGKIHVPIPSKARGKDRKRLEAVLWHEYTHAVIWSRTKGRCPVWLNEGFAEYEESKIDDSELAQVRHILTPDGKLPYEWGQLEAAFRTRAGGNVGGWILAYRQALAVVHYLFKRYRKRRVNEFLDVLRESGDFERATREAFQTTPERLARDVARHVKRMR